MQTNPGNHTRSQRERCTAARLLISKLTVPFVAVVAAAAEVGAVAEASGSRGVVVVSGLGRGLLLVVVLIAVLVVAAAVGLFVAGFDTRPAVPDAGVVAVYHHHHLD
jgi:hypothetical protein